MDKSLFRKLFPRILKAAVKAMIVLVIFLVISPFLAPLKQFVPDATTLIETYVLVYVGFIIAGELTKGTIYQYGLGMGRAFFFIGYTIYALNNGIITQTIQSVTFSANLQVFLIMVIFIGMLDFARSLIQIINHMAEKAETEETVLVLAEPEVMAK